MISSAQQPQQRLDRVRLGMAVFGVLLCLLPLVQPLTDPIDGPSSIVSVTAGLAVVLMIVTGQVRKSRIPILLVPVPGALLVLVGMGLSDPTRVLAACMGLAASQTMNGSRRSILLRTGCLILVLPLSVVLSHSPVIAGQSLSLRGAIAGLPIIPLFTGLIYLLRNVLESQAMTIAREGFMVRLSSGLLAANTVEDITQAFVRANHEFDQVSPGMVTLELMRLAPGESEAGGGARLLNSHGTDGLRVPQFLPAAALAELPPIGVERDVPIRAGASILTELGLPQRKWHAIALEQVPGAPCDLILHGVKVSLGQKLFGLLTPEEIEFLDVIRRTRTHWRSAMHRVQRRAMLIAAQERDDITGLPDLAATIRMIVETVHSNPGRVGLILMHISGLDRVEAEGSIAMADAAMNQLAQRVLAVAGGHGQVGRGGDGALGVILTDAESYDAVESLARRLEDALLEPVLLPTGPVRLTPSLGVARTTVHGTASDLLERAMRSLETHVTGQQDGSTTLRTRRS